MAKTAEEYAAELGAVQKQYQLAKEQGRNTAAYEQQGQAIRSQATAGGADLSNLGAANSYGRDYTSFVRTDKNATLPTNTSNAQSYIDSLNAARRNQVMADLGKSKDNALSNLGAEKATIAPKYYDARNATAAGSQQSARNLAEFMAARGGVGSGANAQAEISRTGTLQGNLGTLGRQETAAFDDIARRTSGVQNAYESDLASANAGLEGDRMQALLNQYNADRGYGLDYAGQFGTLPGGQGLAQMGGNGQANGQSPLTLNAKGLLFNQDMTNKQFNSQEAQRQWDNTFRQGQFDFTKAQQLWDNTFKDKSFDQGVKQFAQQMGMDWAKMNQNQQQFTAEMAFKSKAQQLEQDKFGWSKDPNNPDNLYRDAQLKEMTDKLKQTGIDEYDLLTVEQLADQAGISVDSAKPEEVKSFVAGLKSQHGWSTDEAKGVENYLNAKASAATAQRQAQAQSSPSQSSLVPPGTSGPNKGYNPPNLNYGFPSSFR